MYSFLKKKGYCIILINPHQSKKFHELARRKAKTDKVDSIVIAGLLRSTGIIPIHWYYEPIHHPLILDSFPSVSGYRVYLSSRISGTQRVPPVA